MKLKIYLADLFHDYLGAKQFVPINIGYIGAYCADRFGDDVSIELFKSPDELLDAIDKEPPHILGLSNYCWNSGLNEFVARQVKSRFPDMPIIMGGPNIRLGDEGIKEFLEQAPHIDSYTMFASEVVFADIVQSVFEAGSPAMSELSQQIRLADVPGAYSLVDGMLKGSAREISGKDLNFIPSPYLNGMLDKFLDRQMTPIFETNRGCPFSCTFCVWGISALSKLQTYSLERVYAELEYVSSYGKTFPQIYFSDANFGILKRDVEIAQHIRHLYDTTKAFSAVEMYWSKSAQPHMLDVGKALGSLSHTYVAFQSLDPVVLEGMKRKNIGIDRLAFLIEGLREYSHSAQTDILLGSPGETVESHLRSLDGVLSFGIDHIRGGEIQMLPGSEMDTPKMRQDHQIKTKFRFFEGCAGIYRDELVYELQEVIRATSAMSEEEMKYLRVLRSLFFGAVTIGEMKPLVYVLRHLEKSLTKVLSDVLAIGEKNEKFTPLLRWVEEQVNEEFFDTPADVASYLENPEHRSLLINDGF
ncbi:MAG: hypothetical protein HQ513_15945, partial [Rhodospirillales bacterium]|nr:hypothetical protein [Rhodospirillales bacterium]